MRELLAICLLEVAPPIVERLVGGGPVQIRLSGFFGAGRELILLVYLVTVRAVKRVLHQSRDLVDTEQCLGLVPGDVPTARVFLQGLVCMQPRSKPGEIFLRVQHLNLEIKAVR
jgi:hypothetical protein